MAERMTVEIPCKIGDELCGVRSFRGVCRPQYARVSEMFFTRDMRLMIVLKFVCRGVFGKDIFYTREECLAECERRNEKWRGI